MEGFLIKVSLMSHSNSLILGQQENVERHARKLKINTHSRDLQVSFLLCCCLDIFEHTCLTSL